MKRPSFQFYPADWKNNSKLRRCSDAARGAWVDILCLLHDSDEYGICRWPLDELSRAAGVPLKLAKELVAKDVLKGSDKGSTAYIFTPRHAGKDGEPVTLVASSDSPCWYSSRFVRDEWVRLRRGQSTQFTSNNQPTKEAPMPTPKGGIGDRHGYGPTSSSTSSSTTKETSKTETTSAAPKYSGLTELVAHGVDPQVSADWLKVRKAKKSPETKTGIDAVLAEISKAGMSADDGIRLCCMRGWAGFDPAWLTGQARASPAKPEKFDPLAYVNRNRTTKNERTIDLDASGEPR